MQDAFSNELTGARIDMSEHRGTSLALPALCRPNIVGDRDRADAHMNVSESVDSLHPLLTFPSPPC